MDAAKEAKRVGNLIVEAFKRGDLAEPLALNLLPRESNRPMDRWSIGNRFGCYLAGCTDARTFKQWEAVGRHPIKGSTASAYILMACVYPVDRNDPDGEQVLRGWKDKAVFDISVTDGEPVGTPEARRVVEALPLKDVARAWGVNVYTTDTAVFGAAGLYDPTRTAIGLGVSNLTTWLHELMHAADDRVGNLNEKGQHWRSEIVAELGGAVLAHMIGQPDQADEGGCWRYVERYAKEAKLDPAQACLKALDRIAAAVELIMTTAEQLQGATPEVEGAMK